MSKPAAVPSSMTVGWACLECPEAGETTGTESGQDVKHVRSSGHATTTALTPAAALAIAGRVR